MKKIKEYTYGKNICMTIELDDREEAIDALLIDNALSYKTTADYDTKRRKAIIDAFHALHKEVPDDRH